MERIGLAGYGDRLPSLYSRGMRMKLALVMVFAAKTPRCCCWMSRTVRSIPMLRSC